MYCKDSPSTIQSMFNSIANHYDFTNTVLSFSLHKRWNRSLIHHVRPNTSSHVLIDLCSGTGDIALDYLRTSKASCNAYLIDFSSEMLENAKRKACQSAFNFHQISYIQADVQQIPLSDQLAHCVTMAYGIRNVQNPALCISEAFRILKPGGCLGILELTRPRNPFLRQVHQFYLSTILPFLGKRLTHNQQAYEYLCQSIQSFVAPEQLQQLLINQGFIHTQCYPLAGGIATIIKGYKSLS